MNPFKLPFKINLKPLSVNDAYKGRRFSTDEKKAYFNGVKLILPRPSQVEIPEGKLQIHFDFYFKTDGSDWDNPIKPLQDAVCERYGIKDNRIKYGSAHKHVTKKPPYSTFRLLPYNEEMIKMLLVVETIIGTDVEQVLSDRYTTEEIKLIKDGWKYLTAVQSKNQHEKFEELTLPMTAYIDHLQNALHKK